MSARSRLGQVSGRLGLTISVLTVSGLATLGLSVLSLNHSLEALADSLPEAPEIEASDPSDIPEAEVPAANLAGDVLQLAADQAALAERLTQTAASAADWDQVVTVWLEAIALTQSVPPESPARILAQRRLRGYLQQLLTAQQRTEQASSTAGIPSLGSAVFDAQLAGYLSYVATFGPPDVLIVGSSRSLQGIDPAVLQQTLAAKGLPDLRVYNFSVNGATAQVVNFVLSELLPAPLPAVIVWGDGSRAFNDGRRDRTWESLAASPGYQAIHGGALPATSLLARLTAPAADRPVNIVTVRSPLTAKLDRLDALGFLAVSDRFDPPAYYQQFPQVNGQNDGAYVPFTLEGNQRTALGQLTRFVTSQNSQLIFVNLPLSGSYLDDFRLAHERQFQQFLQAQSQTQSFTLIDLLTQWQAQPALFADPSHVNEEGAAAIAAQLANHPQLRAALSSRPQTSQPLPIPPSDLSPDALLDRLLEGQPASP